ncbi:hypothetical protein L3X38_012592 [Prunus dulcis]|uniref:Uncharacterized protein n=1 Tax=Prunus dulcis TaxID=3755 RepID=A0AAD4WJR9_PRUDU|nr:hypothetical protein L3X38_012592 [Prunus dulcis]
MSVGSYFTKLKGLWDERDALCTFPICTCGSVKEMAAYLDTQKTMKYLMGLNDSYASVRSNTLLQNPLPTVNKAYSLVLRHEKQSEVTTGKAQAQPDAAVFAVKNSSSESEGEKGPPLLIMLVIPQPMPFQDLCSGMMIETGIEREGLYPIEARQEHAIRHKNPAHPFGTNALAIYLPEFFHYSLFQI